MMILGPSNGDGCHSCVWCRQDLPQLYRVAPEDQWRRPHTLFPFVSWAISRSKWNTQVEMDEYMYLKGTYDGFQSFQILNTVAILNSIHSIWFNIQYLQIDKKYKTRFVHSDYHSYYACLRRFGFTNSGMLSCHCVPDLPNMAMLSPTLRLAPPIPWLWCLGLYSDPNQL